MREFNRLNVAGFVLGVISTAIGVSGSGVRWLGLIAGIVGIILSASAFKAEKNDFNTAAFVLSLVGSCLCLIFWIACGIAAGCAACAAAAI
ncbi:MAG: hypothetical protein HUJ76_06235 [Parasporobacterium sp.]|nr:hypothetical protein [Parasporobacterium sp.]